jgi:exonuclease SbcD
MTIIHTADWHIGQVFYEYDRKAEHLRFLQWLGKTVGELKADVLLIAGDVFDSPNPSAESQQMYYSFLRGITRENPELQIIVTAGNHDSAARLEAPNPLLEGMNVAVRGLVARDAQGEIDYDRLIVPLNKGGYCLAVPYLRQGDYPAAENYAGSVKAMYHKLYEIAQTKVRPTPVIAMGHLQATGSEISENDRSERTIIGGLECVSPDAFRDGIAYTALGHLHRGQRVSGRDNVRYSGAPIPMSFAEKNNRQGVVLVRIADDVSTQRIDFNDTVPLVSIPGRQAAPLDEALRMIEDLPDGAVNDRTPYLEVNVLVTEPEPSMRRRIEEALSGKAVRLARISAVTQRPDADGGHTAGHEQLEKINPVEMALKIYEQQYGSAMPDAMLKLLHQTIQEIER